MFDSTLHAKTLARQIRASDFHSHLWNFSEADRSPTVAAAIQHVANGFAHVSLRRDTLRGKPVYQQTSLAEALIIRQVAEGIRRVTGVRQSDRQSIVKSLVGLAHEGVPFHILKFDVKSFYETIDPSTLLTALTQDAAFSRQSIRLLSTFFHALQNQGIHGLPRGLGISAVLSEFAMRDYDRAMSGLEHVRLYNRFVDDAIFVTSGRVDLEFIRSTAADALPTGLALNRSKTKEFSFKPYVTGAAHMTEHEVSFLGYKLDIGTATRDSGRITRKVTVDIADSKIARMKQRIAKSVLQFNQDNNFSHLHGRIKLLTSNYGFVDPDSGQQRFSGLRYNYSLIDGVRAASLDNLDRFLQTSLTSPHPKNRLRPNLTNTQKRSLLGFGFRLGFISNRFFSFDYSELKELNKCWSHA